MKAPLFFSGGTALKSLAKEMAARSQLSYHIITTHDSGGSSQVLRKYLHMPAVGDIRNRLLALAGGAEQHVAEFLGARIPASISQAEACRIFGEELQKASARKDGVECAYEDLKHFKAALGHSFDYRGASLGNLALAGAYLANGGNLDEVICKYGRILGVKARVAPACAQSLHLAALLSNGQVIHGQHKFKDIETPVSEFWLTGMEPWGPFNPLPKKPGTNPAAVSLIGMASLICYPMGSFYSSLLANLLPEGIPRAIAVAKAPKVYIPNAGHDPEQAGLCVFSQILALLGTLKKNLPKGKAHSLLDIVVMDKRQDRYAGGPMAAEQLDKLAAMGINVVYAQLIRDGCSHDPERVLLELEKIECAFQHR